MASKGPGLPDGQQWKEYGSAHSLDPTNLCQILITGPASLGAGTAVKTPGQYLLSPGEGDTLDRLCRYIITDRVKSIEEKGCIFHEHIIKDLDPEGVNRAPWGSGAFAGI